MSIQFSKVIVLRHYLYGWHGNVGNIEFTILSDYGLFNLNTYENKCTMQFHWIFNFHLKKFVGEKYKYTNSTTQKHSGYSRLYGSAQKPKYILSKYGKIVYHIEETCLQTSFKIRVYPSSRRDAICFLSCQFTLNQDLRNWHIKFIFYKKFTKSYWSNLVANIIPFIPHRICSSS